MEILLLIIIIAVILFFVLGNKKSKIPEYTDEELEAMSFDEWKELSKQVMAETKTSVLRIYLSQYKDLKERIESGHKETMEGFDQQSIERSLESLNIVRDELIKRDAL